MSTLSHERRPVKSLPMVQAETVGRDRGKGLTFTREDCLDLARRTMEAQSLAEAAAIIRTVAQSLPETVGKHGRPGLGWREYLLRLAKSLARGQAAFRIFSDKGNTKLPFVSFSALPLFSCPGAGECARWCYSLRAWRYPVGFGRQLQNSLLLRHGRKLVAEAFRKIKVGRTVRLYVDGDFDSLETVGFWMGLLAQRPDLAAYGYSKSWDVLVAYHNHAGGAWPENYRLNLSSGGRPQAASLEDMQRLPITRGRFVAVKVNYRPEGTTGIRSLQPARPRLRRRGRTVPGRGRRHRHALTCREGPRPELRAPVSGFV
jgi:hypothetical protein